MIEANPPELVSRLRSPRLVVSGLAAVVLTSVLLGAAWLVARYFGNTEPDVTAGSPYLNVKPGVKFVGDVQCSRCHADIVRSYREHPMGRSLTPLKDIKLSFPFGDKTTSPSFSAQGNEYTLAFDGNRFIQREERRSADGKVVAKLEAEATHSIGSGEQAVALVLNRDGYLFESPMTWYSRKNKWDLSPGYEQDNIHFDRFIKTECLFCHSNRFDQIEGTQNHYRQPTFEGHAIGCQRCHGPGELHVKQPTLSGDDAPNIVNPARLEPLLRESVCQQCHLQGDIRIVRAGRELKEYRPGLPLHRFESIFVRSTTQGGTTRFFGQVEQMHASQCYQRGKGVMGCISCHDPHALPSPSERVAYYRERCNACHQEKGCGLPSSTRLERNRADSCIDCHMPRSTNEQIPHTASTLHLISRFGLDDVASPSTSPRTDGPVPLVHFHQDELNPKEREDVQRDLGIALAERSHSFAGQSPRRISLKALDLIEAGLVQRPHDPPAWEAKGNALWNLGRKEESLDAFRRALAIAPNQESTLVAMTTRAAQMGRLDEAMEFGDRMIAINPWRSDYHHVLSLLHTQRSDWRLASESARKAIALNPFLTAPRMVLVQALLKMKDRSGASAEFQNVLDLDPPDREQLQAWFTHAFSQ